MTSLVDSTLMGAWRPPERLSPSEWAERHVQLPTDAPITGRLDHRNAPYLPGLMDLAEARGVTQLNVQKAGQIGVSAMTRWLMGYWAELDPSPVGLTLPDRNKGRKIVRGDVLPFFHDTPVLRSLMTSRSMDETGEQIRLGNGFTMHLMWAGSATSTASDALRRVVNDETDKMQAWGRGGGEGHAVHRTLTRMRVYADRAKQVNVSTPTTAAGMIAQLRADSNVHLWFLVPCPHCGTQIRFVWSQVKWRHFKKKLPRREWAARVMQDRLAWYECQACEAQITERQRKLAAQQGVWGTADENGIGDGEIEDATTIEEWPASTSIGVQIGALYCMWESWHKLARSYILALGSLELMFTFITETLGEPFEQEVSHVRANKFSTMSKEAPLPEGVVPWWAAHLVAVIDTQKDHFWIVIRAWGPAMRSARVFHGRVESFADLDRLCFGTPWPVENGHHHPMTCSLVLIDSGGTKLTDDRVSRTMEVYAWAMGRPGHVRAIKGDSKPIPGQFHRRGRGHYDPGHAGAQKRELPIWLLDTHHYQDELAALFDRDVVVKEADDGSEIREPGWLLNQRDDAEYNSHMSALQKVADREGRELVERWKARPSGARIDLRDCEGYQIAAAYMLQINLLPSLEEFEAARQAEVLRANRPAPKRTGITMPDGRPFLRTDR